MSKTVEKALRVLCTFGGDVQEHSLTDLAEAMKFDKATMFRLLKTLEQFHLLMVNPRTKKYRLGPRILELASRFNLERDLRAIALPEMILLRNAIKETVGLSFPLDDGRVCTDQVESQEHVRAVMPIGQVLPYHAGSVGRVILAHRPWREVERVLNGQLPRFSDTTITDPQVLREDLRVIRQNGYAVSSGERLTGSCGLSVAILDRQGQVLGALTAIGPQSRMTAERVVAYVPLLKAAVEHVTAELMGPAVTAVARG